MYKFHVGCAAILMVGAGAMPAAAAGANGAISGALNPPAQAQVILAALTPATEPMIADVNDLDQTIVIKQADAKPAELPQCRVYSAETGEWVEVDCR